MNDLRQRLLEVAFPDGIPELVDRLLPEDWDPMEFGGGPILSSTGQHRFYIADHTDDADFTRAIVEAVPQSAALLSLAPPLTRRMVDTDGHRLDLYLDDLHLDLPEADAADSVMCEVLHHPGGARSRFRFVEQPPAEHPELAPLAGLGRLLRRTGDVESVLWVTEARWTGRVDEALALARATTGLPEAWAGLQAAVPGLYIDGIEVHPDGRVDLTPGVLR